MDETQRLAVEAMGMGKQAIVFVASRASAEKTAEDIAKFSNVHLLNYEDVVLRAASIPTKQCRRLARTIKKGIAFHHAGLLQKQKDLIEDGFRKGDVKVICCTPTLCLSGDTEIWQEGKNTLVKDFKDSSLFVLSQNNKLVVMNAKNVVKNRNSDKLIKITSVSNYSIKLTPNHRILVKRGGKKYLIPASECKKKNKIATVGKLNIEKITHPKISHFVISNDFPIKNRCLNSDDFYFIGSMLGDGYSGIEMKGHKLHYKGSPTFTSGDLESIETIELISKNFDPFSKRRNRLGSIGLVLSKKKWFREFLCRVGIDIGLHKSIHPSLIQADLDLIRNLIQGLFDTDGCVTRNKGLAFSNISLRLIKDLQKILLRFGIVSRVRKILGKPINITEKTYYSKDIYELVIEQNRCILLFHKLIGFRLRRKQNSLEKLVKKISHVLSASCINCDYIIYSDIFSGRTSDQKVWGEKKNQVINLLGKKIELGSRVIEKTLGFKPRHKSGSRLNHHYELISKRRVGNRSKTELFWSLNPIGLWIYSNILNKNKEILEFFKLQSCPICNNKLKFKLRKKWRDSDFDGDIFWDYVRSVNEVDVEKDVYDVVLPEIPRNDHMFVANGFIVHNSAGLSLPVYRVIIKTLKRFSGKWGMQWIPVLEYLQMAGRAGRPEFEAFGEAIVIAKSTKEKDEIYEKYVCGEPEEIYSKLAVEPVLRTYLLSLISSGIIRDEKSMMAFFSKTFWAHQYKDLPKLQMIMEKMLDLLEGWNFVTLNGKEVKDDFQVASDLGASTNVEMRATDVGIRISQLYLDPLTANHLLECLKRYDGQDIFSLLHMVSYTLEMRPLIRLKVKDAWVHEEMTKRFDQLLVDEPDQFHIDYQDYVNSIKTALFFEEWISEKGEDYLLEKYGIRPGEIRMKLHSADWLLYGVSELAKLVGREEVVNVIHRLRIRIKQGVKEELLPLLKLKGVGRVRARKMFMNCLRDLGDLKNVDITSLAQIVGKAMSVSIKKQLGEDVKEIPKGKRKGQLSLMKF